ncbi:MAG TPA: NAD-dependent epimerase/dehydratase family protein [Candidatus Limnocylindrales bacterium]|nr:NAD-dependent epimerase/dehydratase family protein [Candidatus Limnocylindrales bacterium]
MRASDTPLVLVTGGAGFLGSALVRRLVADGHRVRVVDDFSRGVPGRIDGLPVELQSGDVRSMDVAERACRGVDVVIHMAAINGTRHFYERPFEVLEVGVLGTMNFLRAASSAGVRRFQFFSSSEIYQKPSRVPTPEDERALIPDVLNPRFSYAGSKLVGELLVVNFARATELAWQVIRPHNIYGPDMGHEHVIPEIVARLYRASDGLRTPHVPSIEIQGTGEERRAFCYIDDAVDGITLALESDAWNRIFHLGTSEEMSIREVVGHIARAMGIELDEIIAGPVAEGGTDRRCPDIRALGELGYTPSVPFSDGIARSVSWYVDESARLAAPGVRHDHEGSLSAGAGRSWVRGQTA